MNPLQLTRSAPFRLALAYVALFGVSSLLLLGFIYWSTAGVLVAQAEETIDAEIKGLSERYSLTGIAGLVDLVETRSAPTRAGSSIYLLVDGAYNPIAGNLRGWPVVTPDEQGWIRFRLADLRDEENKSVHEARAKIFPLRGGFWLLVGRDFHDLESMQHRIVRTLTWGLAGTVALALLGGVLIARTRLRRLASINAAVSEIMEGDLDRRLPAERRGDDFDQLVENLNRMLDQIQRLMERVRQVSDNIAHDLRTPLTRLRNQLELLRSGDAESASPVSRAGTQGAREQAVEEAIRDADSLLGTFGALLRIARVESSARPSDFTEVDLGSLLEDVAEFYEPLAEERGQTLSVQINAPATRLADRDLLFQALANLVDNAVKYAPAGGEVNLILGKGTLEMGGDTAQLTIADNGPGIPAQLRSHVFERFFRVDSSRTAPGNGLGLSLVEAVIRLHAGKILLEDNEPGLRVVIGLPGQNKP